MDEEGIKHFNSDGIFHRQYIPTYAKRCRGLDYYTMPNGNYLITSETTRHDVKIVLVNLITGEMER